MTCKLGGRKKLISIKTLKYKKTLQVLSCKVLWVVAKGLLRFVPISTKFNCIASPIKKVGNLQPYKITKISATKFNQSDSATDSASNYSGSPPLFFVPNLIKKELKRSFFYSHNSYYGLRYADLLDCTQSKKNRYV